MMMMILMMRKEQVSLLVQMELQRLERVTVLHQDSWKERRMVMIGNLTQIQLH